MTLHIGPKTAHSKHDDSRQAALDLIEQLQDCSPRLVVFFATVEHDALTLGHALGDAFASAHVIGCSSNGEFCDKGYGVGGAVAIALGADLIDFCATAIVDLGLGIQAGVKAAAARLEKQCGLALSDLDPKHWIGLALLEGARGQEERINEALGYVAPLLPFVGGSAGDRIRFERTWVYVRGHRLFDGCALAVVRPTRPFAVLKTCHFTARPIEVTITKAQPEKRLVLEIDGKPAAARYAELLSVKETALGPSLFLANPLGLMVDDEPWLRSIIRREGSALLFACQVLPGMTLQLMEPQSLVADASKAFERAVAPLGVPPQAAILWNCALRMLEAQHKGVEKDYHALLSCVPHVGMQSNGESYLGHINQTLTGLVLT